MKWITPLWSDPIGWSEWVAKTRLRIFICIVFHIVMVFFGLMLFKIANDIRLWADDRYTRFLIVVGGGAPIALIGVYFPALYLYAMHRLLKKIREEQEKKSHF